MFKLISNNKDLIGSVKAGEFIDGSALDVLIQVRSLVHLGSTVLTHPLCGNLRPNHQPFRSVIIDEKSGLVDLESLSLIEEAVHVYESCNLVLPCALDEAQRVDYAYIDSELMRVSLEQFGLFKARSSEGLDSAPLLVINHEGGKVIHEAGTSQTQC